MSIMMYMLRNMKQSPFTPFQQKLNEVIRLSSNKTISPRMQEFRKKLKEKPLIGKLDEPEENKYPFEEEEDPFPPWPNNTNPHTGEIGGPRGLEPTRFGDWERKGRVSDF